MPDSAVPSSSKALHVEGTRLVDGTGATVVLRGFGLGGFLNMENFITGFPGTESQQRRALRRAMGEEAYTRFFDVLLDSFFAPADAEFLAGLGLNSARVPFSYKHFEDDDAPFQFKEEGFRRLDRVVDACAQHGIYAILDLHALPGWQNQHWHSDNPTNWSEFWNQRQFQDRVVHLWEALADRYRDNPWVGGYNPVNEPADASGERIGPFYERLVAAIRAVDPHKVLFLDGNRYSTDFSMFSEVPEGAVFTAHDYVLPVITQDGRYPGEARGRFYDRDVVEEVFLERTGFMRRTGTPIWVGEFGPVYTGDPERDAERLQLLQDQLAIYAEHGASWALWTYKDIGLQGVVTARPDSAYLQRIAPVLEKKRRLGVDRWGGSDRGIRHVLEPLERLFEEEFPDFTPFPWGQKHWIGVLVRSVMLSEPMVDEFAACFAGVGPDEAERLARSFALDQCDVREGLAAVLRAQPGAS
ncbi:aryl-phospho-beta-D-glucosidase BglC (GH1 family) [Motilibacter rhizosphaerae]|uniref:Aryl-phospho-beta-D-glucosidase BglC (GH1 family) n=1 Tax=Motilibacter rhizosphaerae TaxID=598652 RepID=A0A4Q7NA20_9ACTN|nr:glycoside hydrolase family 5 protein [Motilibacter rhizosphaerae]RZS79006.1 aryl-phospho-beta-D-glucosidase BglC (GH1 family) [Motilibacter rhizosphaerae]